MNPTSTQTQTQTKENVARLSRKVIAIKNQIRDWVLSVHLLLLYPQENLWTENVTCYIQSNSRRILRLTIQLEQTQKELNNLCGISNSCGNYQ